MHHICLNCAGDIHIINEIEERGAVERACSTCGAEDIQALCSDDRRLRDICRLLVRIRFSEWEYRVDWGGQNFRNLTAGSDVWFREEVQGEKESFADLIGDCIRQYPDESIPLYTNPGLSFQRLSLGEDEEIDRLFKRFSSENSFSIEDDVRTVLHEMEVDISHLLPPRSRYYRSRIGVSRHAPAPGWQFGRRPPSMYDPYTGADISSPPIALAGQNRFNRQYVSMLYLSSSIDTAISEVRPHHGDLVSIGAFENPSQLYVANFSPDIRKFLSIERMVALTKIYAVRRWLSKTVLPSEKLSYLATQAFSDELRLSGYEGIIFGSALSGHGNLVCFKGENFVAIPESKKAFQIKRVIYEKDELINHSIENEFRFWME